MELNGVTCIDLEIHEEKRKKLLCIKIIWRKIKLYKKKLEEAVTYCLNAAEKIRGR